jgi:hypothetical protein
MPLPTPYHRIEFCADQVRAASPLEDYIAAALALVHAATPAMGGVVFAYEGVDVYVDRDATSIDHVVTQLRRRAALGRR